MKKALAILITVFGLMSVPFPASADYPDGPVQFIVPWPPGDFEDILTRWIAEDMEKATGMAASVVNRWWR